MAEVLQVRNQTISTNKVITLLANYQMLPQFLCEVIIDQAIASFTCTSEEKANARQQFYEKHQLTSESERQEWLELYEMTQEELESLTTRELRIEKFKRASWGYKLGSYFLSRKPSLDKVIYSLIRTKDIDIANELYFRIWEGEQSFGELAREYSQGLEAQTNGLLGPTELGKVPSNLAQILFVSQPGQLLSPIRLGEWVVIVRLERFIPAQLNEVIRQQLLDELYKSWLQKQLVELLNGGLISLN
ncbi:peptidylprolyl isomerase [Scytonema sp. NUACC26]|uniref:peptidylprolyl isomerase n=1 Tax=Scytonema sp. NUACC26 TaxID=3140176 RepID=UPI0034DBEE43